MNAQYKQNKALTSTEQNLQPLPGPTDPVSSGKPSK
jgi:hypothetical protein